jgi:hypothetical protein
LFDKEKQDHERQKQEAKNEREQQASYLKRQNRRLLLSIALSVVMIGMAIFSVYYYFEMKNQKQQAVEAKNELETAKKDALKAADDIRILFNVNKQNELELKEKGFKYFISQSETFRTKNEYTAAISSLEGAKRIDTTKIGLINTMILELMQEGKEFDKQKRLDVSLDSLVRTGSNLLDDENALNGKLLKPETYNNAFNTFAKANVILGQMKKVKDSDTKRIKDKLKEATITATRAFEGYKSKGERFKNAKGWKEALDNYEKANTISVVNVSEKDKKDLIEKIDYCKKMLKNN